ncbi:ionotropic receptor 75a-like [Diabrotica undecimpunctata]|uniref:ionotropic receptor 75a-like n=1 Tax=Diabrotica undecimpunctata TaxID=50387 RepID=UPI003B63F67C
MTRNLLFTNFFENVEFYVNSDIIILYKLFENGLNIYKLEDMYNPASMKGGQLKRRNIGFYNSTVGGFKKDQEYKYWLRRNLTGITLKSMLVAPFNFEGPLEEYFQNKSVNVLDLKIKNFNKFQYQILGYCADYYNYTKKDILVKTWGYLRPDGTFDGMVGALSSREIDYGNSPLILRADRAKFVQYGGLTWMLRSAFIFRDPKRLNSIDMFTKPFTTTVWICLVSLSAFAILILMVALYHEESSIYNRNAINWSDAIINTISVFAQQGILNMPFLNSSRITFLFILICSLMTYQFYSASIVSSLLMKPRTLIKSMEDLLNSRMEVGCESTLFDMDYLKFTNDKVTRKLYLTKILAKGNSSNFLPANDGLLLVKKGGYAFHTETSVAYDITVKTFSEDIICELKEVKMYKNRPAHLGLQKNSPFKDMFDSCLLRLTEYGVFSKQERVWQVQKPECTQSSLTLATLGMENFYPLFIMLLIAMVISLIILLIEIYIDFKERNKRSKNLVPLFLHNN